MRAVHLVQREPSHLSTDAVAIVTALLASQFMLLVTCHIKVATEGQHGLAVS